MIALMALRPGITGHGDPSNRPFKPAVVRASFSSSHFSRVTSLSTVNGDDELCGYRY